MVIKSLPQLNSMVSSVFFISNFINYIENLTNEQYSGIVPRSINALSASRDTLNPLLNTTVLKNRLKDIEYYKFIHGEKYARWPAYFMANTGRHLWKYKFNYAIKGFAAYLVVREIQQYNNLKEKSILSLEQSGFGMARIGGQGAILAAICCLM